MPGRGLEPLRISPPDPKSGASANFATLASSEQAAPPPITARAQKMQSVLQNHLAKFISVRDSRNRRVRGLYQRNGHYYAQLWVDRGYGRKSARKPALQLIRYFSRAFRTERPHPYAVHLGRRDRHLPDRPFELAPRPCFQMPQLRDKPMAFASKSLRGAGSFPSIGGIQVHHRPLLLNTTNAEST